VEGWIKINRKILKHWVWEDKRYFAAWMYCLLRANYEETEVLIGNKKQLVPRGSFITSIRKFAAETQLTERETRTFLKRLESDTLIDTVTTQLSTQINICKYEDYQGKRHREVSKTTHEATTDKEDKEEKNKNPSISPQESLEYLPEHFHGGRFENTWLEWWQYRKGEGWTTKISYAKSSSRDLNKLAGNNVTMARQIVQQSMDKGWRGLFALKGIDAPKKTKHGTRNRGSFDKDPKIREI